MHNCQKLRSNEAASMTSEIFLVSKPGVDGNVVLEFQINYLEKLLTNQLWHDQWEGKRKIRTYLGAIVFNGKSLKFRCKGFDKNQKEAENSDRGCCCQGPNLSRNIVNFGHFGQKLRLLLIMEKTKKNASFIYAT